MTQESLPELQLEQGAVFGDAYSRRVAESYGDPRAEYDAASSSAGIFDVSYTGRLEVAGRDRVRYLHNMLSNDIRSLKAGSGCYAALLTHQGRMESDLFVFVADDVIRLEASPAGSDRLLATLKKYVVADHVEIEDVSDTTVLFSIQGPRAPDVLAEIAGPAVPGTGLLEHSAFQGPSGFWHVARRDRTGLGGFDIWMPARDGAAFWKRWSGDSRVAPCGRAALNCLRTEAGVPWYGSDMDDTNLPMEFGLNHALSFNKGCYRGQEIVARVTYRGHLDRGWGGIAVDSGSLPLRGADVRAGGARVGAVTSAAMSPRLGRPLALALVKTACLEAGTEVEIDVDGGPARGRVVSLPLGTP